MATELTATAAIEKRHSVRKYQPEPIPAADLERLLYLTSLAPSGHNIQPWRFVVVQEPATKERLQEACFGQAQVTGAPAVLVMVSDMHDVEARLDETLHPGITGPDREARLGRLQAYWGAKGRQEKDEVGLKNSFIAVGFFVIAAEALGYSTVIMTGFDPEKVKEVLDLPEHVQIAAVIPVGKGAEEGYPHHRLPLESIVTYK